MEGWNDCPPMMLKNVNSSTSSLNGKGTSQLTISSANNVDINIVIQQLLQHPNHVPDKIFKQIQQKILASIDKLDDNHKNFIHGINQDIKQGTDKNILKNQIVEFMMVNDGVSSWCVPLKKLVENLEQ